MAETINENVIITKKAREKIVKARAGDIALPPVAGMAFGNGGVDVDGNVISPIATQENLTHELYRKAIEEHSYPNSTTCRYTCTLGFNELAGEEISELGLYDTEGDIICIKTFMRKGKDMNVEQTYSVDDIL